VNRSWLLVSAPVALAAILLLSWTIVSLVRAVRGSVAATVPIRAEQSVTFDPGGEIVLNIEGPALARSAAASLRFALVQRGAGIDAPIPMRSVVFRTHVASASRARFEMFSLSLPSRGTYVLRIMGIDASRDYGADAIVFTRPLGPALIFYILSLILLGAILVGSLVASGFAISGRSLTPGNSSATAESPRSLEAAIGRSVAIVRARTIAPAGAPRFRVIETWAGAVPTQIAGSGQTEGLIADTRAATAAGYRAVDGQDVVLLLPAPAIETGERASVVLVEPIAIIPIENERVIYSPNTSSRRELTVAELRRLVQQR